MKTNTLKLAITPYGWTHEHGERDCKAVLTTKRTSLPVGYYTRIRDARRGAERLKKRLDPFLKKPLQIVEEK